ncbi:hypothetical protein ERX37_08465 [Macrococcus hajekii]|uniref:YwiC-like family protein n=1 Tax=Macrococcus hajekii TaxID=198482 RepID=A0A4R6BIU8_9STAP|nr:YwiC-like family protein [Macrococcus hajekii]TDM01518.1 hypothetical protein ERX37_08465 [Macrococcus hajekii]GGB00631.1 membrane protein [Macrococcus hajekii]
MKFKKPNQHGAWAMLIMPFLFGIFAGQFSLYHIPFIIGWFLVFFATDHLLLYVKQRKKQIGYVKMAGLLACLAALALLIVVNHQPVLIVFFLIMLPFGYINLMFAKNRNERHVMNDISAVVIFSIAGCISYFIGKGQMDLQMLKVFIFSFLYFLGTILYVKTMIREKKNIKYKWLSFSYHLLLVILGFRIHLLLGLAMIPSFIRAVAFYGKNYKPMKIGIVEIANACFITLFVAFYFMMK